jgi:hypothetical protein
VLNWGPRFSRRNCVSHWTMGSCGKCVRRKSAHVERELRSSDRQLKGWDG